MRRTIGWAIAVLVVTAAGCGGANGGATPIGVDPGAGPSAPTTATPASTTAAPPVTADSVDTTALPPTAPPTTTPLPLSASSRLRIDGIGPIDVGMTVAQAQAAAGVELSIESLPFCTALTAPRGPAGVTMIVTTPASERIDLIVVSSGPVATLSGIRVGSTEAEVLAAYPGRLRVVNPSWPVHRLVYHASDPSLADRAVVFVVDNSQVVTMYSGLRNQAEADEICG